MISHRGVSNKNGIQNTVQSLEKDSPTKTRSRRDRCARNERRSVRDDARRQPKSLARINATPQDLTLMN